MRNPNIDMNTGLKKGSWSHEEDQMLISYISRYGIWNWSKMPRFAGLSRSGKSCRLRWMNYLNPNVKRGNITKEEEEIIIRSHSILGNKWSAIASRLPGRTDNEVKNHWHAHLKKRVTRYNKRAEEDNNNTPLKLEEDNVDNIQLQLSANIDISEMIFESSYLTSDDHDIFSSSSSAATDQEVDFGDSYYDTGSPGTVDDLQCFWQQLWSFENLDQRNDHLDIGFF